MSAAVSHKGEKSSKKFQSLNINDLYQGSTSKPSQKAITPKPGYQSLGKVLTARRAPANLPSLKSENCGNDPAINLVPTGGTGWASNSAGPNDKSPSLTSTGDEDASKHKKEDLVSKTEPPKTWRTVTGGPSASGSSSNKQNFLSSPLFGQDFPSLTEDNNSLNKKNDPHGNALNNHQQLSLDNNKYGPGPNLRPQTFGNWGQTGSKGGPPRLESSIDELDSTNRRPPIVVQQPKFDVSLKPQPNLFSTRGTKPISINRPHHPPQHHQQHSPRSSNSKVLFQTSIIDKEKLRRMDDIESNNEDDWTRGDDAFDYNKKLASDDEDESGNSVRADYGGSNWASSSSTSDHHHQQNHRHHHSLHQYSPEFGSYDNRGAKLGLGNLDVPSFLDDEDQKRMRKNEEVLKNIERARKRREEEELKYRNGYENSSLSTQQHRSEYGNYNRKEGLPNNRASFGKYEAEEDDRGEEEEQSEDRQREDITAKTRHRSHGLELLPYKRNSPSRRDSSTKEEDEEHHPEGNVSCGSSPPSQGSSRPKDYGSFFRADKKSPEPEIQSVESKDHISREGSSPSLSFDNLENRSKLPAKEDESLSNKRLQLQARNKEENEKKPNANNKKTPSSLPQQPSNPPTSSATRGVPSSKKNPQALLSAPSRGGGPSTSRGSRNDKYRPSRGGGRNRRYKQEDDEFRHQEEEHDPAYEEEDHHGQDEERGWFAPRGQPTRRGRGGRHGGYRETRYSDEEKSNKKNLQTNEWESNSENSHDDHHHHHSQQQQQHHPRFYDSSKRGNKKGNNFVSNKDRRYFNEDDDRRYDNKKNGNRNDSRNSEGKSLYLKTAKVVIPPRFVKQREREQQQNRNKAKEWNEDSASSRWGSTGDEVHFNENKPCDNKPASASPVTTIIFENTNYKGGKSDNSSNNKNNIFKGVKETSSPPIQLPIGYNKGGEDSADLKLDFTFEASPSDIDVDGAKTGHVSPKTNPQQHHGQQQHHHHHHPPPQPRGNPNIGGNPVVGHPSTEDLNMKIASVKKVWETMPSMSPVPENVNQPGGGPPFGPSFTSPEDGSEPNGNNVTGSVSEMDVNNPHMAAKVRPPPPPPHHHQAHHQQSQQQAAFSRMMPALTSPSIQPPSMYQQFPLSADVRSSLYTPYTGLGVPPVRMSGTATDMYGGNQFRSGGGPPYTPNSGGNVLLPPQGSGLMKTQSNQIGPIGTKAAPGNFTQSGLGTLAGSAAGGTSALLISFETPGNQINYMQRSAGGAGSPAFYQPLPTGNPQRQQTFNITNYAAQQQISAQLRSQVHGYVQKPMVSAATAASSSSSDVKASVSSSSSSFGGVTKSLNNLSMRTNNYPTPIQRPHINTGTKMACMENNTDEMTSDHDKKNISDTMDENQ